MSRVNILLFIMVLLISLTSKASPIVVKPKKTMKEYITSYFDSDSGKGSSIQNINKKRKNKKKVIVADPEEFSDLQEVKRLDNESSKEIKSYLSSNAIAAWDFTNRFDVKTGTAIKGILLNSIVSSNLESPLLIETSESYAGIPIGTKFSCSGATKNKRVLAVCNKLITESDEYEVDTILLNTDGTAGLLGVAYSGKEQYAVGAITAAALKGALDVSLDRVNGISGVETVKTTAKNKMKGGGIGALDEIIQISTDEFKTQEPKISIDAGKQVLVYFNRRFKL